MVLILSPSELVTLTTKVRCSAQARVLKGLGMVYGVRPDGSIALLRSTVDRALRPQAEEARTQARRDTSGLKLGGVFKRVKG